MIPGVRKEPCKRVTTYAGETQEANGHLIELFKEGEKTVLYMTAAVPKAFKGYHLHRVRESRYVCLRGRVKITIVRGQTVEEHILESERPERLFIPTNVFIGIENIGDTEAWLVNLPNPSYDPTLSGEQVDKTPREIKEQLSSSSRP